MLQKNVLKITLWPLFIDGVKLPQGYRATTMRLHYLPVSPQEYLVLISSISAGRKVESTLVLLSDFEPGTPELGIQRLNHWAIASTLDQEVPSLNSNHGVKANV